MEHIDISFAVGVHKGKVRKNNEDNFYCNGVYLDEESRDMKSEYTSNCNNKVQLYAVCDGMGGEAFGEIASYIATKTLKKYEEILNILNEDEVDKYIEMYIAEVNSLICEESEIYNVKRIGSTIVLLCINNRYSTIYNVGDSRAYLLRNKKIKQLSKDDTPITQAIEQGIITKEEGRTHPYRNKLTQHLGIKEEEQKIKLNKYKIKNKYSDKILLCSDGLHDMLSDLQLEEMISAYYSEKDIIANLISEALEKGGKDNITAMLIVNKTKPKYFGIF